MLQIRVLRGFENAPYLAVKETAEFVLTGLTHNPSYPVAPEVIVELEVALVEFSCAILLASEGGQIERIDRDKKRKLLVHLLQHLAGFVEANCNNDLARLLSSGFSAVSTRPSRVVPDRIMRNPYVQSERYSGETVAV